MTAAGTRQGEPVESGEYPKGFTCLSKAVLTMWWNGEISDAVYRVYSYLAFLQNDQHTCWPKQATIAAKIGKSLATVKRALKELEDKSLVRREAQFENGEQRASVYTLLPVEGKRTAAHSSVEEAGTVAHLSELPSSVPAANELGGSSSSELGGSSSSELGGSSSKVSYQQQDSLELDSIETYNNTISTGETENVNVVVASLVSLEIQEYSAQKLFQTFPVSILQEAIRNTQKAKDSRHVPNPGGYVRSECERLLREAASNPPVTASSATTPAAAAESHTTAPRAAQNPSPIVSGTQTNACPEMRPQRHNSPMNEHASEELSNIQAMKERVAAYRRERESERQAAKREEAAVKPDAEASPVAPQPVAESSASPKPTAQPPSTRPMPMSDAWEIPVLRSSRMPLDSNPLRAISVQHSPPVRA
jgi:DNA-binding MarR family transcriptional regulator